MGEPTVEVNMRYVAHRCIQQTQHGDLKIKLSIDIEDESLKMSGRKCSFFESKRGCRNGEECPNQHYRAEIDAGKEPAKGVVLSQSDFDDELYKHKQHNYNPPKSQVCKYFKKGNCSKKDCPFTHEERKEKDKEKITKRNDIKTSENQQEATPTETNKTFNQEKICKFFITSTGCFEGENCPNLHVEVCKQKNCKGEVDKCQCIHIKCKFFNNKNGCQNGESCLYLHEKAENVDNSKKSTIKPEIGVAGENSQKEDNKRGCNKAEECLNEKPIENPGSQDKNGSKETSITTSKSGERSSSENIACKPLDTKSGCDKAEKPSNIDEKPIEQPKSEEDKNESKGAANVTTESIGEKESQKLDKHNICRFFNTQKGCFKGKKCPNLHTEQKLDVPQSEKIETGQNTIDKKDAKPRVRRCRYFLTDQGCMNADKCQFSHETIPKNDKVLKTQTELRETELKQLEKRWKERFECLQNDPEAIYNVTISPTDPDWVGFDTFYH